MKKYTCNQCSNEFESVLHLKARSKVGKQGNDGYLIVGCCHNPKCPNFGLIQQPFEITWEEK